MATTIRAVKTGTIRIRPSHRATDMSKPRWRRRLAMILDRDWTQPLPIRTDHEGRLLRLAEQDRSRWDRRAIADGIALTRRSVRGRSPGRFTLMAAIAAVHAQAPSWDR